MRSQQVVLTLPLIWLVRFLVPCLVDYTKSHWLVSFHSKWVVVLASLVELLWSFYILGVDGFFFFFVTVTTLWRQRNGLLWSRQEIVGSQDNGKVLLPMIRFSWASILIADPYVWTFSWLRMTTYTSRPSLSILRLHASPTILFMHNTTIQTWPSCGTMHLP